MAHPIVEQQYPSAEQRPAVEKRGCDVLVTAGAGTGKTRTLVARYLSLLADGLPLRAIVAITFTRKAEQEMRNRVRTAVMRYVAQPNLPEAELDHWRGLYRQLDAARIGTIHSLCGEILRSHPAEAGIDPRFETLEEGQATLLRNDALEQALAWAADDAQAATLFALVGVEALHETLDNLLRRRLDTQEVLDRFPADVTMHWQAQLRTRQEGDVSLSTLDMQVAAAYPALCRLFAVACERYAALKRMTNWLDFDDLEAQALALLRDRPAVRTHWQQQVQAILVDEFQDTNDRQRELVTLLNGKRGCVFIVGDAKQSIYRFRGADVRVFREEQRRVQAENGKVFPLQVSYRAHRELLLGLNDLLRPILGEHDDPERPWVEPFAELLTDSAHAETGFSMPHIELLLAIGTKGGGALQRAAAALAERIVQLVEVERPIVCVDGAVRPVSYGDVAILCRASSSFEVYETALEQSGVPFVAVAGGGFYSRPEIRDLLNALQVLADPNDDLALAGLLRSPTIALSDVDLYRLSQGQDPYRAAPSWWELLHISKGLARLSPVGRKRAARARDLIQRLHDLAGRVIVADLLKAFLDATDYRAALIRAGQQREARNVSKLLADAHSCGLVGVGAFLEYVQGLRDSGVREGEARTPAEGVAQIMSVHQAKGLEFPVVVLGDATHVPNVRNGVLLDRDLGVLLPLKGEDKAMPVMYELAKAREKEQEEAESDRLLYVAATRARDKLIINACIKLTSTGALSKPGGWLGRIAAPECLDLKRALATQRELGQKPLQLQLRVGQTAIACLVDEVIRPATSRALPALQMAPPAPLPPPLLAPLAPGVECVDERVRELERVPAQRMWRVVPAVERATAPAWVVDKLVHEALALWRFPVEGFERWAEARACNCGLTDACQLTDAMRKSSELLQRFRMHDLYHEMQSAERRLHEVPYSMERDGAVENGIIDALYLHTGQWTLVEFKTDHIGNQADLQAHLRRTDYLAQSQRHATAVKHWLDHRLRVLLCLLDYYGAVQVQEISGAQPDQLEQFG